MCARTTGAQTKQPLSRTFTSHMYATSLSANSCRDSQCDLVCCRGPSRYLPERGIPTRGTRWSCPVDNTYSTQSQTLLSIFRSWATPGGIRPSFGTAVRPRGKRCPHTHFRKQLDWRAAIPQFLPVWLRPVGVPASPTNFLTYAPHL